MKTQFKSVRCWSAAFLLLACSGQSPTISGAIGGGSFDSGGTVATSTSDSGGALGAGGTSLGIGGATNTGGASQTGGTGACVAGLLNCACLSGTTCNAGLTCTGRICVDLNAGGAPATGGRPSTGGSKATGGASATGGAKPTGGEPATGGVPSTGGTISFGDGCTSIQAQNLTLQQIALYQSVKIPLMTDGFEITAASRNAGVVEGRETLFRVFVAPGSDWVAREVSARLTLIDGNSNVQSYYSKLVVSAPSVDADLSSSFQISVPASALVSPLRYSVEVVECATQTGSTGQARFPTDGTVDLGVVRTGVLKVKFIPIQYNGLLPDTSEVGLAGYASYMKALYPIADVAFSVGNALVANSPLDWEEILDTVRAQKSSDKAPADVYYYGLVKPASTLTAYCGASCTRAMALASYDSLPVLQSSGQQYSTSLA